jgi:hypothetical protein
VLQEWAGTEAIPLAAFRAALPHQWYEGGTTVPVVCCDGVETPTTRICKVLGSAAASAAVGCAPHPTHAGHASRLHRKKSGLRPYFFPNQPAGARAGAPEGGRGPRDQGAAAPFARWARPLRANWRAGLSPSCRPYERAAVSAENSAAKRRFGGAAVTGGFRVPPELLRREIAHFYFHDRGEKGVRFGCAGVVGRGYE